MAVAAETKRTPSSEFRRHDRDTGSSEHQVAILTHRIADLTEHLRRNRHDYASRRGLLMMVGRRTRLLRYLSRKDSEAYQSLIKRLGLRK